MRTQRMGGYTLIELLSALSISAIVLHFGLGGFSSLVEKTAQSNAIYGITTLLQQARSQAVTTGRRSLICSIDNNGVCLKDWLGNELAVVIDSNGNREFDKGEKIVYRVPWQPAQTELAWSNRLGDPSITFQPTGTVVSNGTLTLADKAGKIFAKLIINNGGRVRLEKP